MVKGSCICGDWTYQYTGEPVAVVSTYLHVEIVVPSHQYLALPNK